MIAKYAGELELDNLPEPTPAKNQEMKNSFDMEKTQMETD
ncbi:conjugal transfer protein [Streptococcus pneumoniae]|nr:conjugal transfer protein [Streptococcus pneumoniae]